MSFRIAHPDSEEKTSHKCHLGSERGPPFTKPHCAVRVNEMHKFRCSFFHDLARGSCLYVGTRVLDFQNLHLSYAPVFTRTHV